MAQVRVRSQLERSLGRFITFDQVTCLCAVSVIIGVYVWIYRSGYLLVLAAMVGTASIVLGLARLPLASGNLTRSVVLVGLGNWSVALGATAVAPFCVPITICAAMLPSVLAVPYVSTPVLWRISVASMCVSIIAVALGILQDFSGLTAALPPWIPDAVLLAFVPFITGLVVMVSAQNSARLGRALQDTLEANARLRSSQQELIESRARLAAATDRERRRIARDLHDGAQQRLIVLALGLEAARRTVPAEPSSAGRLIDRLSGQLQEAMVELRNLVSGIHPPVLTDRGLAEALRDMLTRAPGRCLVEIGPLPACAPEVEAAVYWCCTEAVQNFAKHAGADAVLRVRLEGRPAAIEFELEDDGRGFDPATVERGQGLVNMADRIGAAGGWVRVWSEPLRGVRVWGAVPLTTGGEADRRRFAVANLARTVRAPIDGRSAPLGQRA